MRHYNVANFSKTFTGETLLRKIYFVFLNIYSKQTVIKESCSRIKKWTLQILGCLHCSKMLPVCCDKHMMLTLFCIHFRGEKIENPALIKDYFFSLDIYLRRYINICSFEKSLKWPFLGILLWGEQKSLITKPRWTHMLQKISLKGISLIFCVNSNHTSTGVKSIP